MRSFVKYGIIFLTLSVPPVFSAEIKTSGVGSLDLDAYRGKALYVEFQSSPQLSSELRERFQTIGFSVVPSESEADVSVKVMGGFFFQKPHAKMQHVDYGKVIEQTLTEPLSKKADYATRAPGVELAPVIQGLRGNLSANMVFGAGLVDSILSLSGARGWLNKMVAGDERGFCLGTEEMCKDWKKYVQQARFAAFVEPKEGKRHIIRAAAVTKDEELLPDPLFREGMGELTKRLFGSQAQSEPAAPPKDGAVPIPGEAGALPQ